MTRRPLKQTDVDALAQHVGRPRSRSPDRRRARRSGAAPRRGCSGGCNRSSRPHAEARVRLRGGRAWRRTPTQSLITTVRKPWHMSVEHWIARMQPDDAAGRVDQHRLPRLHRGPALPSCARSVPRPIMPERRRSAKGRSSPGSGDHGERVRHGVFWHGCPTGPRPMRRAKNPRLSEGTLHAHDARDSGVPLGEIDGNAGARVPGTSTLGAQGRHLAHPFGAWSRAAASPGCRRPPRVRHGRDRLMPLARRSYEQLAPASRRSSRRSPTSS